MAKTNYHISLKGYVGGWDFDRADVDAVLAANDGKHVDVLIDSLGGSLATGLSISAAFRNHGDVTVHFVGLNASAATIASLGAKHISIDAGAMYLVHKCSMAFFEWGSLNSDQFSTLIADCEKIKADLDKLDLNIARLYSAKCRKPVEDLLALMKVGGWLTPQEALDWGFVDEITDWEDEEAAVLTDAIASAMATEGMPIPNIPLSEKDKQTAFGKFLQSIASFFKTPENSIVKTMNKTFKFLCAAIGAEQIAFKDSSASLTEDQIEAIEAAMSADKDLIDEQKTEIENLQQQVKELQDKLDAKPAATTSQVVEDSKKTDTANPMSDYINTAKSATDLYNSLP